MVKQDNLIADGASQEMRSFIGSLPNAFEHGGRIIYDKRNQIRLFDVDGRTVVVKRYKRPNLTQCVAYSWFTNNKAQKSFYYASRLDTLGIMTPHAIAAVTCREHTIVRRYYLVTEICEWPSCWSLLDDGFGQKQELASALAAQLIRMHEAGFLHGDTNLSNFLYNPTDMGQISVIDINRSKFIGRPATQKECLQNMFRLTHVRPMLHQIITTYATQRGWDATQCISYVDKCLKKFETRKRLTHFGKI